MINPLKLKVNIYCGFNGKEYQKLIGRHRSNELLVVTTGAHGGFNNPEVKYAQDAGISVVSQAEALGIISKGKSVIAVAGTHGKSTTSAMIAHVLTRAGVDPSYSIGVGNISSLPYPGHYGKGKLFVIEADEYVTDPQTDSTPRFIWLDPQLLVITSVEYDHPDVYPDILKLTESFSKLVAKVPADGVVVACIDNPEVERLLKGTNIKVIWYGFSPRADYRITDYGSTVTPGGKQVCEFAVEHQKRKIFSTQIEVSGRHNAANALAAVIICVEAGVSWTQAPVHLQDFKGAERRFELIEQKGDTLLYDDYAHHPTEIKAALLMARELYPDYRIAVVFQPHTYSRTKALFGDFSRAFTGADEVYLLDIFASAREKADSSVTSRELARMVSKHGVQAKYVPKVAELVDLLKSKLGTKQVIITMGAGDVYKIHDKLIS